jgi:GTP cyclohydrolase II
LTHAIEECIRTAQRGGCGVVIYYRKEGRSLGEVTKYLVYNTRKRQAGGDSAENYFSCTEQVAGVQDARFQAMMPDPLHFLGVTKIHNFISMSDMKYDAIVSSGIKIVIVWRFHQKWFPTMLEWRLPPKSSRDTMPAKLTRASAKTN